MCLGDEMGSSQLESWFSNCQMLFGRFQQLSLTAAAAPVTVQPV